MAVSLVGFGAPAEADRVSGSFSSSIGTAGSTQFMAWSQPNRKIRLKVVFGPGGASGTRCQDAAVDWFTNGDGHYDARVVRNCNPGTSVETDPGGNGSWNDPADFDEANVTRIQRAGSYMFPDSNLNNVGESDNAYGSAPGQALPGSNFSQRIRIEYDNGQDVTHDHYPVRCADDAFWQGYPGSSGGQCI